MSGLIGLRKYCPQRDFSIMIFKMPDEKPQEADNAWAELREVQTMALALPNTGMALAINIGVGGNIHPKNKQEVGRRLALNALSKVYDKEVPFSGPVYKSFKKQNINI